MAKTCTLEPRAGYMPLDPVTLETKELLPRCIKVNFRKGAVLNAVGLSNPGIFDLLLRGHWRRREEPFFLSFMAVAGTPEARFDEADRFGAEVAVARRVADFRSRFGLEVNQSCPNLGHDGGSGRIPSDTIPQLEILAAHLPDVPLVPKFNVLTPPAAVKEIAGHPLVAAVSVSNTLPYGALPDRVDWKGLFGEPSPLAEYGGGGLSGAPLQPLVLEWVREALYRHGHFPKPLIAGGGILDRDDLVDLYLAGAAAVQLGSVAILRPWRVAGLVRCVAGMWDGLADPVSIL